MEELLQHAIDALNNFPISEVVSILTKLKSQKSHPNQQSQKLEISLTKKSVFINCKEFISSRAKLKFQIFMILFDLYAADFRTTRNVEEFRFLNIKEIAKLLTSRGIDITDAEKQIRLPIYELMKKSPNLINSKRWNGNQNKNFGYRLDPKFVRLGV